MGFWLGVGGGLITFCSQFPCLGRFVFSEGGSANVLVAVFLLMLLLKSKFCVQSAMEALRWLSLLLSELICLREIGTKLPSQLLRFEACSIFEVQEYLELFTASTADAAVRATMLAVLTEDRHGEMPWVCLAQSCSLLSALLVAEMGRLKRSAAVHDLSVRHSRLLARAFGPLTQWPRLPDDLPHQVRCLQEMARKELLRRTSMQPGDAEDIFYAPLTWEALATDEAISWVSGCFAFLHCFSKPKP